MLGGPGHFAFLLDELGAGNLALGAPFRRFGSFMYVTTDGTYPLHKCLPPILLFFLFWLLPEQIIPLSRHESKEGKVDFDQDIIYL
jgi:hypothetical protein